MNTTNAYLLPLVSAAIAFGLSLPYYTVPGALLIGAFSGTAYVFASKYIFKTL